jgi:hypothetical protein
MTPHHVRLILFEFQNCQTQTIKGLTLGSIYLNKPPGKTSFLLIFYFKIPCIVSLSQPVDGNMIFCECKAKSGSRPEMVWKYLNFYSEILSFERIFVTFIFNTPFILHTAWQISICMCELMKLLLFCYFCECNSHVSWKLICVMWWHLQLTDLVA